MRRFFGKSLPVHCAVCGKELGRHKYRPAKEWNITGLLCADCHVDKTKEAMLAQDQQLNPPDTCASCGKVVTATEDRNKPKWQWEMESGTLLCRACYEKKLTDYDRKSNFCVSCGGKLGMFYYHPKPAWKMQGNLCRRCWDNRNQQGAR
jgi:DNA-directed RNA polymerase subunit N (RpoN/RPB10)